MISAIDRALAFGAFLFGVAVPIGSKSAIVVLILLAIVSAIHAYLSKNWPTGARAELARLHPLHWWMGFAALTGASSLWSISANASLTAAANTALLVVAIGLLLLLWRVLPPAVCLLAAGWYVMGSLIGNSTILIDVMSGNAVTRWLLHNFDFTGQGAATMTARVDGKVVAVWPDILNWSIAGINILLWPALLLITLVWNGYWRAAWIAVFATIVAVATMNSQHETSKVAILVGAIVFAIALWSRRSAIKLLTVGVVAMTVLVVPTLNYAYTGLALHRAPWVQHSLQERIVIWNNTAEQISNNFWLGIGANGTKYWNLAAKSRPPGHNVEDKQLSVSSHSHNYFLQVWFELGLAGALALCGAALSSLLAIGRLSARVQPFATAVAAVSLTECSSTWSVWHVWLPAAIGLAVCLLLLADRIVTAEQPGDQPGSKLPRFASIWLPRIA